MCKVHWTSEKIVECFQNKGYLVISNIEDVKYQNKINFICPNGHNYKILASNFIYHNQICGLCVKNKKWSFEKVEELYKSNGYKLITKKKDFTNTNQLVDVICPKNHNWKTTTIGFNTGTRCFECNGSKKIPFTKIKEDFENEGYKILNDESLFISQVKTKIEFICPNEHRHSMSYRKFKYGQRCSRCSVSKEEREVKKELSDLGFKFIENDRKTILNPNTNHYLELDIYFPERKVAIEYNGDYWHSLEERRNNDDIKKQICEKLGINLITIDESDWKVNKDATIKSIIDILLNS